MTPPRTHEALVRQGNTLHVTSITTPSPQAGGLLIAPTFVGVCGTDLQILNRTRPDTAEILGHEGAGVVVAAGPGAPLREGQRVVFNPSAQLRAGKILGHNVPGLFQRRFYADAQAVNDGLVLPVDGALPPLCGALVEPVGGIVYAHELIQRVVPEFRTAVVFGAGPIGLLFVTYLEEVGVKVLLVHTNRPRLDTAVSLDLVKPDGVMTGTEELPQRILAWNYGTRLDAAVICTSMRGASTALHHAVEVLKNGGCVEMVTNYPQWSPSPAGIDTDAIRTVRAANECGVPSEGKYVAAEIYARRIMFTGHRGTSDNHLTRAVQVLRNRSAKYTAVVTHVLPMNESASVIASLAESRSAYINGKDCVKAVIDLTH